MAQGKTKVKGKVPANQKTKKKGESFSRRKNAPSKNKKHKFQETKKLQQIISKTVNKKNEDEMRKRAYAGQKDLSQAQLAVQKHHEKLAEKQAAAGPSTTS